MEQVEGSRVLFREGGQIFRRCAKCHDIKSLDKFYPNPSVASGVNAYCKRCLQTSLRWESPKITHCFNRNHPNKQKAQAMMSDAIKKGILIKSDSCQLCGATGAKIEGHHSDYSVGKELEVIWLCASCHQFNHHNNYNFY